MAANFLHGAETIEIRDGIRPIRVIKSAVIGLVGTAPIWQLDADNQTVNEPVILLSARDAAIKFGTRTEGYSIPAALDAIFDQAGSGGVGVVVVVNVFDPSIHKVAEAATEYTFSGADAADPNRISLPHRGLAAVVVTSQDDLTTHVAGTDYTVDAVAGTITRLDTGAIADGATVKVAYDRPDPDAVQASDIIGAVTVGGDRTGMQCWRDCYQSFGFKPSILIAPEWSSATEVATEMDALAHALRGHAVIDAPAGVTPQDALEGRGPNGSINFNFSSARMVACYPMVKVYDTETDTNVLEPLSPRFAGVWSASVIERGYWFSPSNREIRGITGVERRLSAAVNDPSTEVNLLNEAGIVTIFNSFGSGLRTWGNRSLAFPSSTHPDNFLSIRKTGDVIEESIELAMLQFLDLPGTRPWIDSVLGSVEAFLRSLVANGAVVDFKVWFDEAFNPPTELAAGHYTFSYDFMPPPPAERITFRARFDINLLKALTK